MKTTPILDIEQNLCGRQDPVKQNVIVPNFLRDLYPNGEIPKNSKEWFFPQHKLIRKQTHKYIEQARVTLVQNRSFLLACWQLTLCMKTSAFFDNGYDSLLQLEPKMPRRSDDE
jgi:hypothetical protein